MRLLVIDQSRILPWVLSHEFPDRGLEIECVQSLCGAQALLADGAIDAALVSVPPADLPLAEFQRSCAHHEPPIPVLYESCVAERPAELGLDGEDGYAAILRKPATRAELRAAVEDLLARAARARAGGEPVSVAGPPALRRS